jgi:hypothetical protein
MPPNFPAYPAAKTQGVFVKTQRVFCENTKRFCNAATENIKNQIKLNKSQFKN